MRPSSTLLAVPVPEILQCNVRLAMIAICGLYEASCGQNFTWDKVCIKKELHDKSRNAYTLKINMEHKHGGLEDHFPF